MQKRTLRGWFEYLDDPKRELDLSEFMALMLFNQREYVRVTMDLTKDTKAAAEHTEGMVGAIDQLAAGLAERSGIPYATSANVRAALDAQRDEQRQALGGGKHG
jgi:hypothetical protein